MIPSCLERIKENVQQIITLKLLMFLWQDGRHQMVQMKLNILNSYNSQENKSLISYGCERLGFQGFDVFHPKCDWLSDHGLLVLELLSQLIICDDTHTNWWERPIVFKIFSFPPLEMFNILWNVGVKPDLMFMCLFPISKGIQKFLTAREIKLKIKINWTFEYLYLAFPYSPALW